MDNMITGYVSPTSAGKKIKNVITGELHVSLHSVDNDIPIYSGTYQATPAAEAQILNTGGFILRNNIEISGIPYREVANSSGGMTAIIGG